MHELFDIYRKYQTGDMNAHMAALALAQWINATHDRQYNMIDMRDNTSRFNLLVAKLLLTHFNKA